MEILLNRVGMVIIALAVLVYVYQAITHIPFFRLTKQMEDDVLNYGLLHFTESKNVSSIRKEGMRTFKCKHMFLAEKEMVWFWPCKKDFAESFRDGTKFVTSFRKSADVCLHYHGFTQADTQNMRTNLTRKIVAHKGTVWANFEVIRLDKTSEKNIKNGR